MIIEITKFTSRSEFLKIRLIKQQEALKPSPSVYHQKILVNEEFLAGRSMIHHGEPAHGVWQAGPGFASYICK